MQSIEFASKVVTLSVCIKSAPKNVTSVEEMKPEKTEASHGFLSHDHPVYTTETFLG